MIEVRETPTFTDWLAELADARARVRIIERVRRLALGLYGDVKPVGDGVRELRVDYGPGYRVYIVNQGAAVVVLLCGGDKRTQAKDIKAAKVLAKGLDR